VQAASGRKTTVFVSYRRESGFVLAKYIFDHLHAAGYDVFMDVHSLGAGEFEQTTLAEVAARDYFLLVLTSGSLERMIRGNDWLRKELTQAVKSRRTVVPVLAEDFKFEDRQVQKVLEKLPPALRALPTFNAVRIPPPEYFDSAMNRLVSFLKTVAGSAPSHGTDKSSSTAAAPKSVTQAQSALHRLTLPPAASLAKTQSATPWSDLEPKLAGTGVVGVGTPIPKKPVAPGRLPAPTLMNGAFGLTWTEVSKAEKYVLEESGDAEFKNPGKVVYQGPRTSWTDLLAGLGARRSLIGPTLPAPSKYYRVKAVSKGGAGESDWSNIVTVAAAKRVVGVGTPMPKKRVVGVGTPMPKKPVAPGRLPAPTLMNGAFGLIWTEVSKAEKYVLEESGDAEFKNPGKVVYQGPRRSWTDLLAGLGARRSLIGPTLPAPSKYYRVKAVSKGGAGESDWSNIVGDRRSN
jgi:hypothetical protein